MKISIVGNCGSGKSTLARTLHTALGIPVYHVDQYFFKPEWQASDRTEFGKVHNALNDTLTLHFWNTLSAFVGEESRSCLRCLTNTVIKKRFLQWKLRAIWISLRRTYRDL